MSIAWDLIFYFIIIFLGILGLILVSTGVFPNLITISKEASCRSKLYNYCSSIVCNQPVGFDLKGCEEYVGTPNPTKEECEKLGFKCS